MRLWTAWIIVRWTTALRKALTHRLGLIWKPRPRPKPEVVRRAPPMRSGVPKRCEDRVTSCAAHMVIFRSSGFRAIASRPKRARAATAICGTFKAITARRPTGSGSRARAKERSASASRTLNCRRCIRARSRPFSIFRQACGRISPVQTRPMVSSAFKAWHPISTKLMLRCSFPTVGTLPHGLKPNSISALRNA